MKKIAGFTGSRRGMTAVQRWSLARFLDDNPWITTLHHGCCVGADEQAHRLAQDLQMRTVAHVPDNKAMVSRHALATANEVLDPLPYLIRNHRIVDASDIVIAAPSTVSEVLRSGTWACIRYARKQLHLGKEVVIIYPDGNMSRQRVGI